MLLLLFEFLLSASLFAAQPSTADFLIIERPQALTIFNQFQQTLTSEQKAALGSFAPLQIIEPQALLGDEITLALKGKINGQYFYLLQNADRQIVNRNFAGLVKRYRRCTVLNDTVRILKKNIRLFAPWTPGLRTIRKLGKEQLLHLIFKTKGYYYVRLIPDKSVYGWLSASAARYCRKTAVLPVIKSSLPEARLRQRIENRFMAANRKYGVLFSYFEGKGYAARPVPRWQNEAGRRKLIFRLQPSESAAGLKRSTEILLRDVQGDLIGSGWRARYEKGQIIIESSKEK